MSGDNCDALCDHDENGNCMYNGTHKGARSVPTVAARSAQASGSPGAPATGSLETTVHSSPPFSVRDACIEKSGGVRCVPGDNCFVCQKIIRRKNRIGCPL